MFGRRLGDCNDDDDWHDAPKMAEVDCRCSRVSSFGHVTIVAGPVTNGTQASYTNGFYSTLVPNLFGFRA